MRKILFPTALTLLFFSCSNNKIDQKNAFNIIEEFYEYPNVEVIEYERIAPSEKDKNHLEGMFTEKEKAFLLSEKTTNDDYQVASSILELEEVSDITYDDKNNIAIVSYHLKRTNITPFGKSKGYNDGDLITKEAVLQLFDKRWKAFNKPENIIKPGAIKGFERNDLIDLSNDTAIENIANSERNDSIDLSNDTAIENIVNSKKNDSIDLSSGDTAIENVADYEKNDSTSLSSGDTAIENVADYEKNDSTILSNEVTIESTQSPCLITDVFEKNGQTLITVDFVAFKQKINSDGIDTRVLINNNNKLRTFIINSETKFPQPTIKKEELSSYIVKQNTESESNKNFTITVVNGIVTELVLNEITMESTQSPCLITDLYEENGQTLITVDFIAFKQEINSDGIDTKEIINNNNKLRTFVINSETNFPQPTINKEELPSYIVKKNTEPESNQNFTITVVNGNVTELILNDTE